MPLEFLQKFLLKCLQIFRSSTGNFIGLSPPGILPEFFGVFRLSPGIPPEFLREFLSTSLGIPLSISSRFLQKFLRNSLRAPSKIFQLFFRKSRRSSTEKTFRIPSTISLQFIQVSFWSSFGSPLEAPPGIPEKFLQSLSRIFFGVPPGIPPELLQESREVFFQEYTREFSINNRGSYPGIPPGVSPKIPSISSIFFKEILQEFLRLPFPGFPPKFSSGVPSRIA